MQHFLKALPGMARTQIVAPQFFHEFFIAVNDLAASFYLRFRGISFAALTAPRERRIGGFQIGISWQPPSC
jgi:hypothetical protein